MIINENINKKIIPIASGKGGVGKTVIAGNLAIETALNGKNTIVVDLDLGGSNLHTILGLRNTNQGIGNFFAGRDVKFENILVQTPYNNLRFIPGDVLVAGTADMQSSQINRLIDHILALEADYIFLDLGSGSGIRVLDFFLISNSGFVVITPQTTSILNAFGFFKNLVFRFLQRAFSSNNSVISCIREALKERKPGYAPPMEYILERIHNKNEASGQKVRNYLATLHPKIIINMASSPDDIQVGEKLRDLVREQFGIDLECMGLIYSDKAIDESIAAYKPVVVSRRDSLAAREIVRIAQKILQSERFPIMPLELDYYADSFELARIEADGDFEELRATMTSEEALDFGPLIGIINMQKKEIAELRSTVRMLTMKNRM
ncbi:MAG: P-loop NTPase [Spirochaetota bacterium]